MEQVHSSKSKSDQVGWIKKIGVAGFLFFLIKGLVWLAVLLGLGELFS